MSDLKAMDKLLYWKEDENGERVAGQGPSFSPKLIEFKARKDKNGKEKPYQMSTIFYLEDEVNENGDPVEVNPLDFLSTKTEKRYCYARPAVKFESIFFGAKVISIQCKITECDVASVQMGPQRMLHGRNKVNVNNKLIINKSSGINPLLSSAPVKENNNEEKKSPTQTADSSTTSTSEGELTDAPVVEKKKKTLTKKKITESSE